MTITPETLLTHNITTEEYARILALMKREPTFVELGVFSVMWSEHCSYKSSRVHLKRLPTRGERVIVPPGENAGVVDVGDGWCAAFKVESHNHPSFIEPFQGAATGVGGILRDIFTMGARPVAAMNSIRFGSLDDKEHAARNRRLLSGVVGGIAHYGNCLTGDERITVKCGDKVEWLTIGEFCERFMEDATSATIELNETHQVLSFDEIGRVAVWRNVRRVFKRQSGTTLMLKTSKGRTLRVTRDHPVLVCDGQGKLEQKLACNLQTTDALPVLTAWQAEESAPTQLDLIELLGDARDDIWVSYDLSEAEVETSKAVMLPLVATACARHKYRQKSRYPLAVYLEMEKRLGLDRTQARVWLRGGKSNYVPAIIPLNGDFARLIGYYLAEGCTSTNGTTDKIIWVFGANANEREYVADLCRILDCYGLKYSVRETETTRAVWLSSWFLGALFRRVLRVGANSHSKSIPDILMSQPRAITDEVLKGLLRGDGSIIFYPPEKGSRVRMTWATVSRRLFEQVTILLQAKGIVPSLYTKPERETVIHNRTYTCRPAYYMEFRDYESIRLIQTFFSTMINARVASELDSTNGTLHSFPRHTQRDGYAALKVTSIEEVHESVAVYDLEVDDTHNFITSGGIITHNCFGVATVGGETVFDEAYNFNPLVNAFALGLVRNDGIFFGKATGLGNPVLYVGAKTGRDGIHGATMASAEFDEAALEKRPTVQVGDPFLEKLLLEACLEAMRSGGIAGIQDMGAAGLTSSSCEMAARAGTGLDLNLDLVPQRETGMTAYEMMLSESQERMLLVAHKGREREIIDIFRKWDLDAVVVGSVTDTERLAIHHKGELQADIPVTFLTDEAPVYQRPLKARTNPNEEQTDAPTHDNHARHLRNHASLESKQEQTEITSPQNYAQDLLRLIASPNIASKRWVYRQYDYMVRTNTVVLPGADAAVVRIKETRRALAMCLDGNGRRCAVNPREAAKHLVSEAARNVVCVGATPIAVTNCLNFASPERPEVMWDFSETIDGMAEACRMFDTPVISGNVSFYNETDGRGIPPTPVIGMVGLIEDVRRVIQPGFKKSNDLIAVIGTPSPHDDAQVSEYASIIEGKTIDDMRRACVLPPCDLEAELAVQKACLALSDACVIRSAHDIADGGFAVALAECCFSSHNRTRTGAAVKLNETDTARSTKAALFSEMGGRIIVSFAETEQARFTEILAGAGCPYDIIGRTTDDDNLTITTHDETLSLDLATLETAWRTGLDEQLSQPSTAIPN